MESITDEERRQRRRESMKLFRLNHPDYDLNQRKKPEYREREIQRMKNRYQKVKFFKIVRENLPHFLTA
jgi:hypothetical protein